MIKHLLKVIVLLPTYMILHGLGILKNKIEYQVEKKNIIIDKGLLYLVILLSYPFGLIALLFEKWE